MPCSSRLKADAKVDRVTADTHQDAAAKQADARNDANADKRDADFQIWREGTFGSQCQSGRVVEPRRECLGRSRRLGRSGLQHFVRL